MAMAVHWLLLVYSFLVLQANAEEAAFDVRRHLSTVTRSPISSLNLHIRLYSSLRGEIFMVLDLSSMD